MKRTVRSSLQSGRAPARRRHQSGGALLAAMIIVTLVTTLAASMVWQQWRSVQVESAERALVQSQWILRGALDYGRLILREDGRNGGPDHLGEPWAVGLAESRISSLLAADRDNTVDAPDGFLSGALVDMGSRYNLYNLIDFETVEIIPAQLTAFKRLCEYVSVPASQGEAMAQALRKAILAAHRQDPEKLAKLGGESGRRQAPLLPQSLDQLTWLGVDAGTVERLRNFVVLLPAAQATPVNVNTASREVLAAVLPGADLNRADRLVQVRQRNPFKTTGDVQEVLGNINLADAQLAVASSYFEIQGRLRLEDRVLSQRYLVERTPGGDGNVVVLFENQVAGMDIPEAPDSGGR